MASDSLPATRVREHAPMVEGERTGLGKGDPRRECSVIRRGGNPSSAGHEERDAGRGFPGIPIRPRIDPDDAHRPTREPGLLPELSDDRLFDGFSKLDEATGEGPEALKWGSCPAHQ